MLPRFVNPHLSRIPIEKTSRNEVFHDNSPDHGPQIDNTAQTTLKDLHKRLHDSLEFKIEVPPQKRRKLSEKETSSPPKSEPILFKLLSDTQGPKLININPPPKPPPHYREPDYEDTEEDAARRREYSKAVAVDYDWVIQESTKTQLSFPAWKSRILHATLSPSSESSLISSSSTPILILDHLQPVRHTRPPVSDELLTHHPYVANASLHPENQDRRKTRSTIPVVEISLHTSVVPVVEQ
ncbi:hypothetical protein EV361DRAFT_440003 [Lentinula raphanica]|nr:hypothetical protein EV361DRAFT_440003 [Lentinula raphanica]